MIKRFLGLLRAYDWYLFGAVLILFCIGLVSIYSTGLSQNTGEIFWLNSVFKQCIFFAIGIFCMIFLSAVNYLSYRAYSYILYVLGLITLIALLFFAPEIRGTQAWFSLFGFTLQPVEFVKMIMILVLARFGSQHLKNLASWKSIFLSGLLIFLPFFLVLLQPDLGSGMVLVGLYILFLLTSKLDKKKILLFFSTGVALVAISWFFVLQPYQKERIMIVFDSSLDPLGVGYNVTQSLVAVGSGGFFGKGLGAGTQGQLNFLPEVEDDFIFSLLAEELGFIGAGLVLFLFGIIFWRIFVLVRREENSFGQYIALGYMFVLFVQLFINIGMNLGIMPVAGIPLPFVSSGGSALIAFLMGLGMIQSVVIHRSASSFQS